MKVHINLQKVFTAIFSLTAAGIPFAANAVHGTMEMGTEPATFSGSPTLWIAIVIGITVAVFSIYFSITMTGSTVGSVMRLFGIGMFLIVSGFISIVFDWSFPEVQKYAHDGSFILGCLFCLWGIFKIRRLSQI